MKTFGMRLFSQLSLFHEAAESGPILTTWRISEVLHMTLVGACFWVLFAFYKMPLAKGSCGHTVASGGSLVQSPACARSAVTARAVDVAAGGCMIERHHFKRRGKSIRPFFIVAEIYFVFPLKNTG